MEFGCEKRLARQNVNLSERYKNAVFSMRYILENYNKNFPEYTDHSLLHVMDVIDIVNQLAAEHLSKLSDKELYILLMGVLVHDVGMGIPSSHYEQYAKVAVNMPKNIQEDEEYGEMVRKHHHRLSAGFVKNKWKLLDIPDEEYAGLISLLALGHRGPEIHNREWYPEVYVMKDGSKVSLCYLAALLRLADEMDVSQERVPELLYKNKKQKNEISRMEFQKHKGIYQVSYEQQYIILAVGREAVRDKELMKSIDKLIDKLKNTALECAYITMNGNNFQIQVRGVKKVMVSWE